MEETHWAQLFSPFLINKKYHAFFKSQCFRYALKETDLIMSKKTITVQNHKINSINTHYLELFSALTCPSPPFFYLHQSHRPEAVKMDSHCRKLANTCAQIGECLLPHTLSVSLGGEGDLIITLTTFWTQSKCKKIYVLLFWICKSLNKTVSRIKCFSENKQNSFCFVVICFSFVYIIFIFCLSPRLITLSMISFPKR